MKFPVRTSVVRTLRLMDIGYASVIMIGDLGEFTPVTEALAVQREISKFNGNEGDLEKYSVFVISIPDPQPDVTTDLTVKNTSPFICVNNVSVVAVSSSALVQTGNCRSVRAETRIKHIRQLLHRRFAQHEK